MYAYTQNLLIFNISKEKYRYFLIELYEEEKLAKNAEDATFVGDMGYVYKITKELVNRSPSPRSQWKHLVY